MANTNKYLIDGQATDPTVPKPIPISAYQNAGNDQATVNTLASAYGKNTLPQGYDYNAMLDLYSTQAERMKGQVNQGYQSYYNQASAQQTDLTGQYDKLRGQAYSGSRLSAIGNNEALAAQGLAGNLYSSPTSGYSETARIYENVALRNIVANYNEAEKETLRVLTDAIRNANLQRQQQLASIDADYSNKVVEETKYNAQIQEQKEYERQFVLSGYLDDINNANSTNIDTHETTLRQAYETGALSEKDYNYLRGEHLKKAASLVFTAANESGNVYDLDPAAAKEVYDLIMANADETEKKIYQEAYEKKIWERDNDKFK